MPLRPIVFLPGYYGSKFNLKSTNEVIWIDLDDIFSPSRVMALLRLDQTPDPIYVSGILESLDLRPFFCINIYKKLTHFLRRTLKYPSEQIHGHAIDWRQSLNFSADRLHNFLKSGPFAGTQVDFLCHSHGGLVARAYLTKHGTSKVARCITLGTPHHGMLKVLEAIYQGIDLVTFKKDITKPAARTMPSAYELFPRFADHGLFTWNGQDTDPLSQTSWADHEPDANLSQNLKAASNQAKQTTETLLPNQIQVPAYFIYGTYLETLVNASGGTQTPLNFTRKTEGDSTVATVSAQGRGITGEVTRCPAPFANHTTIFNNPYVRKLLKSILLQDSIPHGDFQVSAQWENRFYFPNTSHKLSVEVRDKSGEPLAGTQVNLVVYRSNQFNHPIWKKKLTQSPNGDFSDSLPLPISNKPLRYRIKITHPKLPANLRIKRGFLHMR